MGALGSMGAIMGSVGSHRGLDGEPSRARWEPSWARWEAVVGSMVRRAERRSVGGGNSDEALARPLAAKRSE